MSVKRAYTTWNMTWPSLPLFFDCSFFAIISLVSPHFMFVVLFCSLFSFFLYFTDRCVSKYLDSQQLIGEVLRKANEAQLQQQQQMVQLQKQMGG